MAAPLRVVRTPQVGHRAALTASATPLVAASAPVTDTSQLFKSTAGPKSRNWQAEVWDLYRCVGEFGYVVRDRARSCSRVKLIASELDPDTGQPTGGLPTDDEGNLTAEAARVAWYVRSIAGGALGQAEYVKRAAINLQVPGEYQSAIIVTDKGERWLVLNKDEITRAQRARRGRQVGDPIDIELPEGGKHPYNPDKGDGMFRVWNPAGWKASEPDSPARAALDPLREIRRCSAKIEAADDSRLFGNGLLVIPQEASLPSSAAPTAADKPAGSPPTAQVTGQQVAATLQELLVKAGTYALKHGGPARVAPTVIGAPAEHVDKIKHVKIADEATPVALETRQKAIGRLAMSLDIPAEKLLGVGTNTNHWSSYQISDEDVQLHIKPIMQVICQAIYDNVLRGLLEADGIDPNKYTLWFDASEITADPDKSDEASEAHERGMLTGPEYRRHKGLPEEAGFDLDTREGWEQLARQQAAADPTLIPQVLPLLPKELQGLDWPEPAPAVSRGDDDHGDPPEEEPVDGSEPDTEDDARQAAAISGPTAWALAERALVGRGLELYGKRARTRADASRLASVPFEETHRYMPAVSEADIPRLIAGWDNVLSDPAIANLGIDLEALRSSAYQVIRRELTSTVVDGQVL